MIASVHDYALYMLDPEGRVVSWNPGAEKNHGLSCGGNRRPAFFAILRGRGIARRGSRRASSRLPAGRFEERMWRVRKDGERYWANVIITPIRDSSNRLVGFVKITRDLTERRKTEEERLRLGAGARGDTAQGRIPFHRLARAEDATDGLQLQLGNIGADAARPDELATRIDRAENESVTGWRA